MAAQAQEEEGKAVVNKYQNQAKFAVPVDRHTVSAHCRARGYSCNHFVVSQGRRRQDPVPGVNELVTVIEGHLEIGDVGEVMSIEEAARRSSNVEQCITCVTSTQKQLGGITVTINCSKLSQPSTSTGSSAQGPSANRRHHFPSVGGGVTHLWAGAEIMAQPDFDATVLRAGHSACLWLLVSQRGERRAAKIANDDG